MKLVIPCLIAALAAGALALPASAQEQSQPQGRGAVDPAQLVVTPYTPKVFSPEALRGAAMELFGDQITVATTDGEARPKSSGFTMLPHFVVIGQLLLVRDTAANTEKIIATFGVLEREQASRNQDVEDANRNRKQRAERASDDSGGGEDSVATQSLELRPRYVSFQTLYMTLKPFERMVQFAKEGGSAWTTRNLNPIQDGNLIVVCETEERMKTLQQLVDRVDRPQPQMIVTVTLLRAAMREDEPEELPKELAQNLKAMLPAAGYRTLSVGALRCAMQSGQQCELKSEGGNDESWKLSFFPGAFNPATNEFSVTHCQFFRSAADLQRGGNARTTQSFDTSLTFRAGEYVVLGGVGDVPTLVVLRVQPVAQAH